MLLIKLVNTTPQPMETPYSSKTPNETEKEDIMPVTVDEFPNSTHIQKPSQSNQESNSANIINVTQSSTSCCRFDQTAFILPGASSTADTSTIIKNAHTSFNTSCLTINFSISSTYYIRRITENILIDPSIVPHHLAGVFYQLPHTKQQNKKHAQIKLTGRDIIGTEHAAKIKEKLESDVK